MDFKEKINRIPAAFKNFYLVSFLLFLVWVLFFDNNDLFTQARSYRMYNSLLQEEEYYKIEIIKDEELHTSLNSDKKALEKLAREKYLMTKPGEKLYIIEHVIAQ